MGDDSASAIDETIAAFYAGFDNRQGTAPSGSALRARFAAAATITRVSPSTVECWTVEEFLEPRIAILTDGTLTDFHEWETDATTSIGGSIAGRWSAYRKSGVVDGIRSESGGRKLIQLYESDGSWLISSILWEDDAT